MNPNCPGVRSAFKPGPSRGRATASNGFTLVSAIFLMVVLVVLGGSVVTLSAVQHSTSAVRIQSVRATFAARAGLEWAIRRTGSGAGCNGLLVLGSMTVDVACSSVNHTLNGDSRAYVVATATATATGVNWGGTDYVSRQLQAKVLGP